MVVVDKFDRDVRLLKSSDIQRQPRAMKRGMVMILLTLALISQVWGAEAMSSGADNLYKDMGTTTPLTSVVRVAPNSIVMPKDRILLIRNKNEYCAIKFTRFWTGKTDEDWYAEYESYCCGDETRGFSGKNVKMRKETLSFPKPRGIGRLAFSFGNKEIRCGSTKLRWWGNGTVAFYGKGKEEGDYGIELSPTPWTNISQVDLHDHHIQWYRFDANRKSVDISIDTLWSDLEGGK